MPFKDPVARRLYNQDYMKKWRALHPEANRLACHRYYLAHPEKYIRRRKKAAARVDPPADPPRVDPPTSEKDLAAFL
jgi:hypothetical protein